MSDTVYEQLLAEKRQLQQWVEDLQSGQLVTCEFCGERFGPIDLPDEPAGILAGYDDPGRKETPMQRAFKLHLAKCQNHPAAALVRCCIAAHNAIESVRADRDGISDSLLAAVDRSILAALESVDQRPFSTRRAGFTFIEVLFAVIILGIGCVMMAMVFSSGMQQTGAVMTDTRAMQVLRNATQAVQSATERPGSSALLPGAFNAHQMPVVAPMPQAMMSQVGGQFIGSDNRYGFVCFYRRDTVANPFCQLFTIALKNSNFPLYSKPIPIPPSLYGAATPTAPTIEGTLSYASAASSITFASSVTSATSGAFVLIADDETLPQVTTYTDPSGVTHTVTVLNNAPLTGRLLRLGNPLSAPVGTIAFTLEPGKDLLAGDMAALASDGNSTGKVMIWMIGSAPLSNPAAGDFSGPFTGPNQDVGANSSFCAIVK